jgi:glycosyltransferase involved in cell wall biosynthesis
VKVVIVARFHPHGLASGGMNIPYMQAKRLAELGVRVYFFAGTRRPVNGAEVIEKFSEGPVTEYRMSYASMESLILNELGKMIFYRAFDEEINKIDPDIINYHTLVDIGLAVLDHVRAPRAKTIYTNHSYFLLCENFATRPPEGHNACDMSDPVQCRRCFPALSARTLRRHRDLVFSYVNKKMSMLTTPGELAWRRHIKAGIPPEKIRWIPNGTDIQPVTTQPRKPDGVLRLIFVGRDEEYKGLDILLAALENLPAAIRSAGKIHLHIVGPMDRSMQLCKQFVGQLQQSFETRLDKLLPKLTDMVTLHGMIPNAEIAQYINAADCLVMPSRVLEVRPCVIQEAFACGRPVICSNIGGMADMVRDGVDGLHFEAENAEDLRDKLLSLLQDPSLLPRLHKGVKPQRNGLEMAEDYLNLYRELLSDKRLV